MNYKENDIMKRTILALTAMALLAAGVMAQPAPQAPGGMRGHGHFGWDSDDAGPGMLLRWGDELGLTDQQKTQLEQLTEKQAMERVDKEAALEKAEIQMRHLRIKDASEKEVLAAMDKVGALRTDLQKMRYQHRQGVKALLTSEQLAKIKELRQERGKKGRGDCNHPGPCRGDGVRDGDGPHGRGMGQGDGMKQGGRI